MNLIFMRCVNERERTIRLSQKKLIYASFHASVLLSTMDLLISLRIHAAIYASLTMLWRNSWSITGQTHEKLTSICTDNKILPPKLGSSASTKESCSQRENRRRRKVSSTEEWKMERLLGHRSVTDPVESLSSPGFSGKNHWVGQIPTGSA